MSRGIFRISYLEEGKGQRYIDVWEDDLEDTIKSIGEDNIIAIVCVGEVEEDDSRGL